MLFTLLHSIKNNDFYHFGPLKVYPLLTKQKATCRPSRNSMAWTSGESTGGDAFGKKNTFQNFSKGHVCRYVCMVEDKQVFQRG